MTSRTTPGTLTGLVVIALRRTILPRWRSALGCVSPGPTSADTCATHAAGGVRRPLRGHLPRSGPCGCMP
jgi:hypothetical protein